MPENRSFYIDRLRKYALPFWLTRAADGEQGGYFTRLSAGGAVLSTEKDTVVQGRMAGVLSELARRDFFTGRERSDLLRFAASGAEFLMRVSGEQGGCAVCTDRAGGPLPAWGAAETVRLRLLTDCGAAAGLAAYAVASGRADAYQAAAKLYGNAVLLAPGAQDGEFRTSAVPLRLLEAALAMARAGDVFCEDDRRTALAQAAGYAADLWSFADGDGTLRACGPEDGSVDDETLPGRSVDPGRAFEAAALLAEYAGETDRPDWPERCAALALRAFGIGWDGENGGLYRFCDRDGGAPRGVTEDVADADRVERIVAEWSRKTARTHALALLALSRLMRRTGKPGLEPAFEQTEAYALKTFAPEDGEGGGWTPVCDLQGRPVQGGRYGSELLDPYSVFRALLELSAPE